MTWIFQSCHNGFHQQPLYQLCVFSMNCVYKNVFYTNSSHRCDQTTCLATGMDSPIHGGFELRDNNTLVGWVSQPTPVKIWLNEQVIQNVAVSQLLRQSDGRMGFRRELTVEENGPGLKLFRAFAVVQTISKYYTTLGHAELWLQKIPSLTTLRISRMSNCWKVVFV